MNDSYKLFSKYFTSERGEVLTTKGEKFSYNYDDGGIDTDPESKSYGKTFFYWDDDEVDVVVKGNKLTITLYDEEDWNGKRDVLGKYEFNIEDINKGTLTDEEKNKIFNYLKYNLKIEISSHIHKWAEDDLTEVKVFLEDKEIITARG